MEDPYRVGGDVTVLPDALTVPGVGVLPVHAFVLHAERPVLVDTGIGPDGAAFVAALREVVDPATLSWIWLTHDDSDHVGNLAAVLEAAPQARLACHGFTALRASTACPLPLDRVHALRPGDCLDVGDRSLVAVRPPTWDNPMSLGFFDERSSTLFPVDSFGALLPDGSALPTDVEDVDADDLVGGMVAWATFDSPWAHLTDRSRFAASLEELRRLGPERVLSSHLPPATGRLDALLDVMRSVPDAPPFEPPDAAAFSAIVAAG